MALETEQLTSPPPLLSVEDAATLVSDQYGIEGSCSLLTSERDLNFKFAARTGATYLLKISHPAEDPDVIAFQTGALVHVGKSGANLCLPKVQANQAGSDQVQTKLADGRSSVVRLLTFLDGRPVGNDAMSDEFAGDMARQLAALDRALASYFHPSARYDLLWDISRADRLADYCPNIANREDRELAAAALTEFSNDVKPRLDDVPWQVIFNDLNPHNVLIDPSQPDCVAGIIDFGDAIFAPRIVDLAVALSYQIGDADDPLGRADLFIHHYMQNNRLDAEEVALLSSLIKTRLAATLAIAGWRAGLHPDNRDYILRNVLRSRRALITLSEQSSNRLTARFSAAAGIPLGNQFAVQSPDIEASDRPGTSIDKRSDTLGPAYRLFYDEPLHLVRAKDVWMFDADGRPYLDAYNNVAQIGHCHPTVVNAITSQTAQLNTHTRYLHDGVIKYAERLLATMPQSLDTMMFTCSGSEANDLALRIAGAATGGSGLVVSTWAYHGGTEAVFAASPSYHLSPQAPTNVRTVRPPGSIDNDTPERFAKDVAAAFEDLAVSGVRPSALLIDPLFTSDGVYPGNDGSVAGAAKAARQAGALVIIDEVQSGFGRTGKMWFAPACNVVPDIMTMGKPMGAGYPLAGVAVGKSLVEAFAQNAKYFNTFGGNPVASAAGAAVLDVLESENLIENAKNTGTVLDAGLQSISKEFEILKPPRSAGMMHGVTIVGSESQEPDEQLASNIVNRMKNGGVLISAVRAHLKIRPILTFSNAHVDQLLTTFREVMKNL